MFLTGIGIACLMQAALNSAPVRSRAAHWLSEISFSVYLCHLAVIIMVKEKFHMTGAPGVMLVLALTLGLSLVTYWLIEKPGMAWGRRLTRRQMHPANAARNPATERLANAAPA